MKNPSDILIVGAGGVARYAFFPLLTMLKFEGKVPCTVRIMDADTFEEHNLDRQINDPDAIGVPKAEYLAKEYEYLLERPGNDVAIKPQREWFMRESECPDNDGAIFCFADNNEAWLATLDACDFEHCHAFRGANEVDVAQGIFYHPSFKGTDRDPRVIWPEILEAEDDSPVNCTGEKQESAPQTCLANGTAAVLSLRLAASVWQRDGWDVGDHPSFFDAAGVITDNRRMSNIKLTTLKA